MKKLLVISVLILLTGVAFGQTLQKGGSFNLHVLTVTLDPDVTMNQWVDDTVGIIKVIYTTL